MGPSHTNPPTPSRAAAARKSTAGDPPDRRNQSPASNDRARHQPPRHVASPPPAPYSNFPPGYVHLPPTMTGPPHPPSGRGSGPAYPAYGAQGSADTHAYAVAPYPSGGHPVEPRHFARPPSRTQSQSSGSGSGASPLHEIVPAPHYAPHYSPSYSTVSSNPSAGHSGRTRWAWVPIEVPHTHLPDDAHMQYPPYHGNYYPTSTGSAASSTSSSHQPYPPAFGEGAGPMAASYGVQVPPNYPTSYPYPVHPNHYASAHQHSSHRHGVTPGRGSWSGLNQHGSQHPGANREGLSPSGGGGSRRQTGPPSRSVHGAGRPTSNSSGNQSSSPMRGPAGLPRRPSSTLAPEAEDVAAESDVSPQALGVAAAPLQSVTADTEVSPSATGTYVDVEGDLDAAGTDRVPGRGLRPHYHPQQGPRSDFVLWCGNVPQDATVEELWEVFSRLTPSEYERWLDSPEGKEHRSAAAEEDTDIDGHGVLSIFIISRSNCAFVNYASTAHLDRAVLYFNGKQVRPHDARCPKLVCRVRKKDDEAQAGVAGQRGRGIHVAWLKEKRELERALAASNTPTAEPSAHLPPTVPSAEPPSPLSPMSPPGRDSAAVAAGLASAGSYSSSGSASYTSTNSSLFRHPAFRHRFFILKSLRADDLERSIETGYWATQPHNEAVLDQAYRNSETVYLVFGVNQTGQFYGYAKMAGPIHTHTADATSKEEEQRRISLSSVRSAASASAQAAAASESVGDVSGESGVTSASDPSSKRPHPVLDKHDIQVARGLFGNLSIDGAGEASQAVPMTSPLPITPLLEEAGVRNATMPQRSDTITPRTSAFAQSSTWPYSSSRVGSDGADSAERPKLTTTLSAEAPAMTAEPDEYGVRRIDMETESTQTTSSQSDQPSLGPSDSASWSSADPRMAEQIALRAVIHNLRLDEMESRGKAERLESQLRHGSNETEATVTAAGSERGAPESNERTPPRQSSSDSWGKPFRVEWICTEPLPFQRVKKLRNPWRDNRQVKVSRDGTELEPGVGRQLLEEWNRLPPASSLAVASDRAASSSHTPAAGASAAAVASDEEE
ncbi:hypothetical protein PaG_05219 [Moesziomyces aphidis]|uniref:YTH domain-containing protein n=1 Tax=Moesziomyces aphidis TaxID=84754 RepID=W3VID3_MOEAP|nr:hypothetical protein PaG_05219 [Moesziomyces aphidis]